ncbi:HD domain-containing protein [Glaciecola sp. SC05]|uniref:HD domain-containing protein n=1 Tax=Glaciecola sp. SC05 TaxID=1987355 RepID=UPI0035296015
MTSNENLVHQPLLTYAFNQMRFKGTYFLTRFVVKLDKQSNPFWEVSLSDVSGSLTLYCRDQSCVIGRIQPESLVHIEAQVDTRGVLPYFRCKLIQPCSQPIGSFTYLSQLPSARCAKPDALMDMYTLARSIKHPLLVSFLTKALLQPDVGLRFIQCPASLNHHHNYAGGLLEHSVEIARQLANERTESDDNRDLAIVAALLHDIGKTQTLTPKLSRTSVGSLVDHNDLTLELCAAALSELSKHHAGFANHLRHVWTCATPGARYGFKPKSRIARLLQLYDRMSAA